MTLPKINIDVDGILDYIATLGSLNYPQLMWFAFTHGGWILFLWFFLFVAKWYWINHRAEKYGAKRQWVCLSVSTPSMNEQSPKAVEHIFSQLAGAHASANWYDTWVEGRTQDNFSLEIISTEGNIQFIIRTITKFRDLVEAAVFAQYPDAEVHEVPDYTEGFPKKFPDEKYDLWGTEFVLTGKECYPIRTYPEFEHPLTGEFKDPLASFLENLSHLGRGEHLWFQIVLIPIGQKEWKSAGEAEVKRLIGAEIKKKRHWIDTTSDIPLKMLEYAGGAVFGAGEEGHSKPEKPKEMNKILYLTPGERDVVSGIERKLTKIGFRVKMRALYVAKKEVFVKTRAAHPLIGAIKQFNTVNLNSLKPEYDKVGTGGIIFFATPRLNKRKTKLMAAYRSRSNEAGAGEGFVLNIEELASIYHFPAMQVKAPLLKKTSAKRAEPPFALPIEVEPSEESTPEGVDNDKDGDGIPDNLPIE